MTGEQALPSEDGTVRGCEQNLGPAGQHRARDEGLVCFIKPIFSLRSFAFGKLRAQRRLQSAAWILGSPGDSSL